MKFLNFFKTTLGISILILSVIAIIVIYLNWDTIKAWWSADETGENGTQRTGLSGNIAVRSKCVNLGDGDCSYNGVLVPCSECRKRNIVVA